MARGDGREAEASMQVGNPGPCGSLAQGFPSSNFRVITIDQKGGLFDDDFGGVSARGVSKLCSDERKRGKILTKAVTGHIGCPSPAPVICPAANIGKVPAANIGKVPAANIGKVPAEDERRKVLMKEKDDLDISVILEQTRPLMIDGSDALNTMHVSSFRTELRRKLSVKEEDMWLYRPENRLDTRRPYSKVRNEANGRRAPRNGPSSAQHLPERMMKRIQHARRRSGSAALGRGDGLGNDVGTTWPVMSEHFERGKGARSHRPVSRQKAPKEALDLFPEEGLPEDAEHDTSRVDFSCLFLDDVDEFATAFPPKRSQNKVAEPDWRCSLRTNISTPSASSSDDDFALVGGFNPSEVMVLESVDDEMGSPEEKYFESLYGLLVRGKDDITPLSKAEAEKTPYPQLIRPQHPPMGKRKSNLKPGTHLNKRGQHPWCR